VRQLCTWSQRARFEAHVTEFLNPQIALAHRPGHVKNRDQLMDAAYGEHIYVDDGQSTPHPKRCCAKKFKAVDTDFAQIETLYGVGIDTAIADPSLRLAYRSAQPRSVAAHSAGGAGRSRS